ncbi:MAG: DUF4364 family protein [Eubacteriales bacterium]|jgi:DNA-binding PadR family transcriptional regulator
MELRRSLIRDELEIKTYILFILKHFYEPVPLEVLNDLSLERVSSYFEFMDALHDLMSSGMVESSEPSHSYMITVKGRYMLQAVEKSLRSSTRRHISEEIESIIAKNRRDSAITTNVRQEGDSYNIEMSLDADHGPILKLELRASDKNSADKLAASFRAKAEKVYLNIIDTLTAHDESV